MKVYELKEEILFNEKNRKNLKEVYEIFKFINKEQSDLLKSKNISDFLSFLNYISFNEFYYFLDLVDLKKKIHEKSIEIAKKLFPLIEKNDHLKDKFFAFHNKFIKTRSFEEGKALLKSKKPFYLFVDARKNDISHFLLNFFYRKFLKEIYSLSEEELINLKDEFNYLYLKFEHFKKEKKINFPEVEIEFDNNFEKLSKLNEKNLCLFLDKNDEINFFNKRKEETVFSKSNLPEIHFFLKYFVLEEIKINKKENDFNVSFNEIILKYSKIKELDYEYLREIYEVIDLKRIDNFSDLLFELNLYEMNKSSSIKFETKTVKSLTINELKLIFNQKINILVDIKNESEILNFLFYLNKLEKIKELSFKNNNSLKLIINSNLDSFYRYKALHKTYLVFLILLENLDKFIY